jgi:hypothetical protein
MRYKLNPSWNVDQRKIYTFSHFCVKYYLVQSLLQKAAYIVRKRPIKKRGSKKHIARRIYRRGFVEGCGFGTKQNPHVYITSLLNAAAASRVLNPPVGALPHLILTYWPKRILRQRYTQTEHSERSLSC